MERQTEGKMTDWAPVLIMALVVVCVTAYLLLDPKFRPPLTAAGALIAIGIAHL